MLSCGQSENIGGKLSQPEIEGLRLRAAKKCLSDSNSEIEDFVTSSNNRLTSYGRNDQEWDYTYKKSTSTTAIDTHKIFVWKVTASATYFRIRLAQTPPKNIFLKFTKTQNNDIMKNLQAMVCNTVDYKGSAQSSSSVTVKKDDTTFAREDSNTLYKLFRTYSYLSSLPAFFGELKIKTEKKLYDNNETYKSVTSDTYDVASFATPTNQDEPLYTDNTDYPNRTYCMLNSDNPTGTNTYREYKFPISFLVTDLTATATSNLNCATGTDNPTITVGSETFAPATELLAPF